MRKMRSFTVLLLVYFFEFILCKESPLAERTSEFWKNVNQQEFDRIVKTKPNFQKAKNVILFLGDGMSTATVTGGRILKGQLQNKHGEETVLSLDKLPYTGFSKTYSTDSQVSDSAATATAYLCGVKTNSGMLGVTAAQTPRQCKGTEEGKYVESFLTLAAKQGKSAGIVTTAHVVHATPAGAYAHTANRDWYCDSSLSDEAVTHKCKDISLQLIESSHNFQVILGGGRAYFHTSKELDPENNSPGKRKDGRSLIEEWKKMRSVEGSTFDYVWNKKQLDEVNPSVDYLFGLFEPKHMQYELNRNDTEEPSLSEMTSKAIEILSKNPKGFTLLVEGGRIDHGHHSGVAKLALHDLVAFDKAIETGLKMTSTDDTLTIVTADHGHTMSIGGYSNRGNPIFGLAPSVDEPELALDNKTYTTILYANGPGYNYNGSAKCKHKRENLTDRFQTSANMYHQQAAVPLRSETHGGEDVGVYAVGPYSHLLTGVYEQSYIAHVIMYAACIGENTMCDVTQSTNLSIQFFGFYYSESQIKVFMTSLLVICVLLVLVIITSLVTFNMYRPKYQVTSRNDEMYSEQMTNKV